jgi:Uncharacterized protein conserved in bacteria
VLQPVDWNLLLQNRDWLVNWERQQWNRKADGLRLHLGSGHIHLNGYTNVDPYTEEADVKEDMRFLSFKPNTAIEIVCHHSLEHIPIRDVFPALQSWYEILAPGGTVEIGMPDIELCMQAFLESNEKNRFERFIWTIYGSQADDSTISPDATWDIRKHFPLNQGQVHMGGFTLPIIVRMLEDIGFRMIKAMNYDGNGTASLFVYAEKPLPVSPGNIFEQDTVIGTFTNKPDTYLPNLWASARKHIPNIQFITHIQYGKINEGMTLLREDFIKTGKRFWCFLDDDIQFLNPDIIKNALNTMLAGKYAGVHAYSIFDESSLTVPYNPTHPRLVVRQCKWMTGYFVFVDSQKVGNILPDMNLPDGNTSVDTSYSVSIRAAGFDIGMTPDYVYHVKKVTYVDPKVVEVTNAYLMKKWGNFYYQWTPYDGNVLDW